MPLSSIPFLLFALLVSTPLAQAEESEPSPNCWITILTEAKTEKISKRVFPTHALDESDCSEMAEAHRTVFSPRKTHSKTVTYSWKNFGEKK